MEKLLHERLREHKRFHEFKFLDGKSTDMLTEYIAREIADEIERYYIPRPRFEDGEPVQFGDATSMQDNIKAMLFKADGCFETHQKFENKCGTSVVIYEHNEPVKRSTPKVYDADGVEIKVGDTIFYQETGNEYTVVKLDPKDEYHALLNSLIDGKEQWHCIARFIHERPVFDADGVRICMGDTVWTTVCHDWFEVASLNGADGTVECVDYGGKSWEILPSDLTHREPDSLEKLLRDMGLDETVNQEYYDRLTAIIESGA